MSKDGILWNKFQCTTDRQVKRHADSLVHPPEGYSPLLYSAFPNREHITAVMKTKSSIPIAVYSKEQLVALFKDDELPLVKECMALSLNPNTFEKGNKSPDDGNNSTDNFSSLSKEDQKKVIIANSSLPTAVSNKTSTDAIPSLTKQDPKKVIIDATSSSQATHNTNDKYILTEMDDITTNAMEF